MTEEIKFDQSNEEARSIEFDFNPKVNSNSKTKQLELYLKMTTNSKDPIAFKVFIDANPIDSEIGVIAAISILIFFNILINTEVNGLNLTVSQKKGVRETKFSN